MSRVYLTFDFEIGWGSIDDGGWPRRQSAGVYRDLRPLFRELVAALDDRALPCTWAVVGAILEPDGKATLSHLDGAYLKDAIAFQDGAEALTRDGRDLLDVLLAARAPHRFATHGYTHVSFQDTEQSAEGLATELSLARDANRRAGLDASRLVFPRNQLGHLDIVHASGIDKVRTPAAGQSGTPRGRLARGLRAVTAPPAEVTETMTPDGLVLHSGTEFLNWGVNASPLKVAVHKRRLSRAIRMAASGRGDAHFWVHPFNLVETKGLFPYFLGMLATLEGLREKGQIDVVAF